METHANRFSNHRSSICSVAVALAAGLFAVTSASAQAWVPQTNSGFFDITYARTSANHHLFSQNVTGETGGNSLGGFEEYSNIAIFSGDYGITEHLAVRGDLAYVSAKYVGDDSGESGADDGEYHGTVTDFHAEFRYAVNHKNFAFTPFAGVVIPTHQYETVGHAAPGRGLWQLPVGFGLGYVWPHEIHTTYIQARYAYAFLRHEGNDLARSNAIVEAGTNLARWCSLRAVIGGERTHGGIDWATAEFDEEVFEAHDAEASSQSVSAAAGLSFAVNRTMTLSASYSQILGGANTVDTKTIWVGTTWNLGVPAQKMIGRNRDAGSEPTIQTANGIGGRSSLNNGMSRW